jgi:hypothetical protein
VSGLSLAQQDDAAESAKVLTEFMGVDAIPAMAMQEPEKLACRPFRLSRSALSPSGGAQSEDQIAILINDALRATAEIQSCCDAYS